MEKQYAWICNNKTSECKTDCPHYKDGHAYTIACMDKVGRCHISVLSCDQIEIPRQLEPTGQLYILPSIAELLADTDDPIEFTRPYDNGIEAVYASAKPVDIEALAKQIVLQLKTLSHFVSAGQIQQAIEDYIKE